MYPQDGMDETNSLYSGGGGVHPMGFAGSLQVIDGKISPSKEMDMRTAEEWTRKMKNSDGTAGPHWSVDQVKQLMQQKPDLKGFDLPTVYAVLNMLYSDYGSVLHKYGANNIDAYVAMAKAWLDDEDAGKGKTMAYYECIAK